MTRAAWVCALRDAARVMTAVLGSFGCAVALHLALDVPVLVVVLSVVLALTLGRVGRGEHGLTALVTVPVVGEAASGVAWLILHEPWLGQSLLVVGLSVGILARRFEGRLRDAGRLVSLPFLAVLVTPAVGPPTGLGGAFVWAPVAGLLALAWTSVARAVVGPRPGLDAAATAPAASPPPTAQAATRRPSRRRVDVPTSMALQMALGLAAALVAGHLLFGRHWPWAVLTAYIVASGNRGRGDVAHKAVLRSVGAAAGTIGVALSLGRLDAGDQRLLVVLFVVMAVGLVLRAFGYAWWAAAMTGMQALLHAYSGISGDRGSAVLVDRLGGIVVGGLLGVASAWFVLPVRTGDLVRRRIADCLAALTDDLAAPPPAAGLGACAAATAAAADRLGELTPALRAGHTAHRTTRRRHVHPYEAVQALRALAADLPTDPVERRRLRGQVVRVRRSMVGKDAPDPAELRAELATVLAVVARSLTAE
ncbi:MAG: FUSC family protein [Jatrophihabitans sp.]|uniref:FUSC family protein n=1 Tax=Jatrophihabitans sp. TaxID=1932789 RepID=UPI003F7F7C8B